MIDSKCDQCAEPLRVYKPAGWGWRPFCSRECKEAYEVREAVGRKPCVYCGTIKSGTMPSRPLVFCSSWCETAWAVLS